MTIAQLRYFYTLAQTCHFTKTAEKLYISQSSLSYAITELEKELGAELFIRRGKKISLSESGKLFFTRVSDILDIVDASIEEIRAIAAPLNMKAIIGFLPSVAADFVNTFLYEFNHAYPKSENEIVFKKCQSNAEIIEMIKSGEIDLAICSPLNKSFLAHSKLFTQKISLYVYKTHPLASKPSVALADIQNEHFIQMRKNFDVQRLTDHSLAQHSFAPKTVEAVDSFTIAASYISSGIGIGFLPKSKEIELLYGIVPIELSDLTISRPICVAWHKSEELNSFASTINNFLVENGKNLYAKSNQY